MLVHQVINHPSACQRQISILVRCALYGLHCLDQYHLIPHRRQQESFYLPSIQGGVGGRLLYFHIFAIAPQVQLAAFHICEPAAAAEPRRFAAHKLINDPYSALGSRLLAFGFKRIADTDPRGRTVLLYAVVAHRISNKAGLYIRLHGANPAHCPQCFRSHPVALQTDLRFGDRLFVIGLRLLPATAHRTQHTNHSCHNNQFTVFHCCIYLILLVMVFS